MAILIGAILIISVALYFNNKTGSTDMEKPSKTSSFTTNVQLDVAMKAVIKFAQSNGYKVDDFNEQGAIIVLSDVPKPTTYGNIFPIYFRKQGENTVEIEVGIKSKSPMPVYHTVGNQSLERCFIGIKTAIYAA